MDSAATDTVWIQSDARWCDAHTGVAFNDPAIERSVTIAAQVALTSIDVLGVEQFG